MSDSARKQHTERDERPVYEVNPKYLPLFTPKQCASLHGADTYNYRIYEPAGIADAKLNPAVIALHGGNCRGSDNELQLSTYCVYSWADLNEEHLIEPCYVIAPQQSEDYGHFYENDIVESVLADVLKHYPIDPDRVYLTGTSMGSMGAWGVAAKNPDLFAGLLLSAGIYPHMNLTFHENGTIDCVELLPEDYEPEMKRYAIALRNMPIRQYYSECDTVAPFHFALLMEAYMREAGSERYEFIRIPETENIGHGETYQWIARYGDHPFEWLLSHRRNKSPVKQ